MAYTSPTWVNGTSPALNAANLQALTNQVEADQVLYGTVDPTSSTQGNLGQIYCNTNTSNVFVCKKASSPYVWYSLTNPKWYQLGTYATTSDMTSVGVTINLPDYLDNYLEVYCYINSGKTSGSSNTQTLYVYLGNSNTGTVLLSNSMYGTSNNTDRCQRRTTLSDNTYANLQPIYFTNSGSSGDANYARFGSIIPDWHFNQVYMYYNASSALRAGSTVEVYGLR